MLVEIKPITVIEILNEFEQQEYEEYEEYKMKKRSERTIRRSKRVSRSNSTNKIELNYTKVFQSAIKPLILLKSINSSYSQLNTHWKYGCQALTKPIAVIQSEFDYETIEINQSHSLKKSSKFIRRPKEKIIRQVQTQENPLKND